MNKNFLEKIGIIFGNLIIIMMKVGPMRIGASIFLILIIILSIMLLQTSSQPFVPIEKGCDTKYRKNYPGIYLGSIVMVLSFTMLAFLLFGEPLVNEFRPYFIFGFGTLFFILAIMVLVGFLTKSAPENFANNEVATGVCEKNGEFGILVNGVCKSRSDRINSLKKVADEQCKKKVEECQKEKEQVTANQVAQRGGVTRTGEIKRIKVGNQEETEEKCICDKEDFVSRGDRDGNRVPRVGGAAAIGICQYKDDEGKLKFGYSHPYFGKKCVSKDKMNKMLKDHPEYRRNESVRMQKFNFNPYQSTQCFGMGTDKLLEFDLKCKEKFGNEYGVKSIEGFGCAPNDNRGMCETGYQMGRRLEANSTKCVPVGTDMNMVCQRRHLREKNSNFVKMGYKSIEFGGCPNGFQRAICDGNFYDGKQLFNDATECFPQAMDPHRMCKSKFGELAFAERIISENCKPGNIRAVCKNITRKQN